MTKKIFAMFLAVLMVVSMLPTSVFAAEGECPGKGTGNHTIENCKWEVVNVTAPEYCKDGYTSYKCLKCGDIFVDSYVEATGEHEWVVKEEVKRTCEKDGYILYECTVCGETKKVDTEKRLYTDRVCEWKESTTVLDCTVGGEKIRTCQHAPCGAVETKKVEKKDFHVWGEPVLKVAATPDAPGVAVVSCTNTNCEVTKEVKVFFAHDCVPGIVPAVEPNCNTETNGTYAHYECRVCGKLFDMNGKETTAEKLVWNWEHDFGGKTLTCLDAAAYCYNECCKKNVPVSIPHDVEVTSYKAPTCINAGYQIGECKVCEYVVYNQIPALGHLTYTVSQAATCGTYAYTYTVCLRGCAYTAVQVVPGVDGMDVYMDPTNDIWYDVTLAPHFLVMNHTGVGKTVYFNGTVSNNYYLGVTEKVEEAVVMFKEEVEELSGAYYFYFMNENNEKVYVDIIKTETGYVNAVMASKPTNYFTWNVALNAWTVTIDNEAYYLGARADKKYFNIDAIKNSKYPAATNCVADMDLLDETVLNISIDYKGGLNENAHKLITIVTKPSCHTVGSIYSYCYNHSCPVNYTEYTVLEKVDHNWIAAEEADVIAAGMKWMDPVAATCTEKGFKYVKCAFDGCGKVELRTEAAKGHDYDPTKATDGSFDGNHTTDAYDYWTCKECGVPVPTNFKKWWGLNHTWKTLAEAEAAHGCTLIPLGAYTDTKGDCANLGLRKYKCSDANCGAKVIYVKVMDNFELTGAHSFLKWECYEAGCDGSKYADVCLKNNHNGAFVSTLNCVDPTCTDPNCTGVKEATCTEKGYFVTYQCTRCGAIIGNAALGHHNEIAMKDHEMVANKNYKVTDCDEPVFTGNKAYSHYCKNCDYKVYPTHQDNTLVPGTSYGNSATSATCTTYDYTYYKCACGEEHIINFVGKFGHEMVADGTKQDPTHWADGWYGRYCLHCSYTDKAPIAQLPHKNAAGEEFYDSCIDTVTDRHCVVCCKHADKGNAHDCYTADVDKDGVLDCLNVCLIGKAHDYKNGHQDWVPSTCTTNAHTLWYCADCGKEDVEFAPSTWWNGHKPEAAGSELYANYQYEYFVWKYVVIDYVVIDEVPVKVFKAEESDAYLAKFDEYVAPTYTEAGYYKAYCTECKMHIEQVLPKKEGLGFELKVENANGAKEFTFGSLIEVTVSANSAQTAVYGFDFDMLAWNDTVFVGYETLNDNFILTVTDPENVVGNMISITGYAANDASGKMQNVDINADTQLVKLYFRCMEGAAFNGKATFEILQDTAKAWTAKNGKMEPLAECHFAKAQVPVRAYLNFNNDSQFHVTDLYLAMSLLTGEHADGKTYDVTMDINKDGEFTLEELSIAYNFWVGNYDLYDLLVMGIDEAELPLLHLDEVTICNNSVCQKEIAADATYCPYCGNHQ